MPSRSLAFMAFVFVTFTFYEARAASSKIEKSSEPAGAMAFVEWNPAALKDNAISVTGEYLIIDGVSFGTLVKVTDKKSENLEFSGVSIGGTLTQYLFEQTLSGPFLRGDFSLFADKYSSVSSNNDGSKIEEVGYISGASMGLVAGYRFMFTRYLTGSAGYGVIRNMPEFFGPQRNSMNASYFGDKGDWRFEVLAGVGVSF